MVKKNNYLRKLHWNDLKVEQTLQSNNTSTTEVNNFIELNKDIHVIANSKKTENDKIIVQENTREKTNDFVSDLSCYLIKYYL